MNEEMKSEKPSPKPWFKNIIIYELYVDKFSNNFKELVDKLDYLKFLGVNCVHLLPHYPSPMFDDGYDVTDYLGVRKDLGIIKDVSLFVKKAHHLGIKVIIDFVLNHTSTQHPWFVEARSSVKSDKRDFYLWSKSGKGYAKAPNLFPDLKNSNWIYNHMTDDYYFSTFHQQQADLNWNNPKVFSEMVNIMDFWIAMGVDGFRLDAVSHLVKQEGTLCEGLPQTHAILKKMRSYLDTTYGNIILLAEVGGSMKESRKYFGDGEECQLVYNFPLVAQLLTAIKNGQKSVPRYFIEKSSDIPENCDWVNFLGHHDEMALGTAIRRNREKLLSYFDQEGKYRFAVGISLRIATMLGQEKEKIIGAFKMMLSVPGSVIIYYGDEIGMGNETLLPEEKDTRKSLRGKFNWNTAIAQKLDHESLLVKVASMIKERAVKDGR